MTCAEWVELAKEVSAIEFPESMAGVAARITVVATENGLKRNRLFRVIGGLL
jgi:hypothetical protein